VILDSVVFADAVWSYRLVGGLGVTVGRRRQHPGKALLAAFRQEATVQMPQASHAPVGLLKQWHARRYICYRQMSPRVVHARSVGGLLSYTVWQGGDALVITILEAQVAPDKVGRA
jgi:hypothetical protein